MFYQSGEGNSFKNQQKDYSIEDEVEIEENDETPNKNLKKVVGCVMGVMVVLGVISLVFVAMKNGYDKKLQE